MGDLILSLSQVPTIHFDKPSTPMTKGCRKQSSLITIIGGCLEHPYYARAGATIHVPPYVCMPGAFMSVDIIDIYLQFQ